MAAAPGLPQPTAASAAVSRRDRFLAEAARHDREAREAAASGDIASAARLILLSLDCERRAGSVGPQVLQLIKPRP